ncbi:MAG: polysaccharide biosynthesis/export family protein [Gemmataceae bacterium]|nr:polysaccharide biosynthesis/export family protein [Gemmataceae bacterium]
MARNTQRAGAAVLFLCGLCTFASGCLGRGEWDDGNGSIADSGYSRPRLLNRGDCNDCGPKPGLPRRGSSGTTNGSCATGQCYAGAVANARPVPAGGSGIVQASAIMQHDPLVAPPSEGTIVGHGPIPGPGPAGDPGPLPRELQKVSLPPHRVAPPDVLLINLVRMVPRPPYRVEPLEVLAINVTDTLPNQPISGFFTVSPEGAINLGYSYGALRVVGMTIDEIQAAVRRHLANTLRNPQANVSLAQFRGMEQIRGEHLVRPDGTVSLGSYGSVYVSGLSLGQAKCVIEEHLSRYMLNPQISIDVLAYNSRVYYIILDGAGFGQQVFRLPATGNETVLDAIGYINGLAPVSSKRRVWLARPSPVHLGCNQILPVDWDAIVKGGSTATNYQVLPGDRVYVDSNPLIRFNNRLSQVLAPFNQVFGTLFLGSAAANQLNGNGFIN